MLHNLTLRASTAPHLRTAGLRPSSTDSGFTLAELIVVILVVALLAAVAIPTFLSARHRALESRARTEVTALGKMIQSELMSLVAEDPGGTRSYVLVSGPPARRYDGVQTDRFQLVVRESGGATRVIDLMASPRRSDADFVTMLTPLGGGITTLEDEARLDQLVLPGLTADEQSTALLTGNWCFSVMYFFGAGLYDDFEGDFATVRYSPSTGATSAFHAAGSSLDDFDEKHLSLVCEAA